MAYQSKINASYWSGVKDALMYIMGTISVGLFFFILLVM